MPGEEAYNTGNRIIPRVSGLKDMTENLVNRCGRYRGC
jgi:hypothetical protein